MKKIISLIIAVAMIMTMLPVHYAFAEGETTEEAVITIKPYESNIDELDWYTSATTQDDSTKAAVDITKEHNEHTPLSGISTTIWKGLVNLGYGEKFLSIRGVYAPGTSATFTVDQDLVIPETGTYNLTYLIGGPSNTYTRNSGIKIEIAPTETPDEKVAINSYTFTDYSENYDWLDTRNSEYMWLNDKELANIEAGTYKVYISVYGCYSETPIQRLTLGDIILTPAEPTAISATQKTTLEYETYTHYGEEKTEQENLSNGAAAISFNGRRNGNTTFINMPVTVSETAVYNWEAVLAKGGYTGRTTILIDGKEFGSNADADAVDLGTNFAGSQYLPMKKYLGEVVLTAGEHMIQTTVAEMSSRPDLAGFGMDYISFEKTDKPLSFAVNPVAASNIGNVAIYEDSAYTTPATIDITNTNTSDPIPKGIYKSSEKDLVALGYGNEYLSVIGSVQTKSFSYDLTDTITVPKTGYYKMRYAIGGDTGYAKTSKMKLEFAPKSNPTAKTLVNAYATEDWTNKSTGTDNPTRVGYGSIESRIVWSNEEEYTYLEAGEYIATYTVYGYGSASASNNYNLLVSPMEFTEATDFEEISTEAKTTIEFEDYSHYGNAVINAANASGSAAMGNYGDSIVDPAVSIIVPITVVDDARYSFETVLANGGWCTSPTTIYIDGKKLVASTDESGVALGTYLNAGTNHPLFKFTGVTELTAGTHEIKVVYHGNLIQFAADYISFEKAPALTHYAIKPYAPSTLDDAKWYTDAEKTTPAEIDLSTLVSTGTAPTGITKLTNNSLKSKGFGDSYLSIRNVYAETENGTVTYTLDDTLKIEATDFYRLSYAIGGETSHGFSGISVELEDVNDPTKKNVITRYVAEDYSNDNSNAGAGHGYLDGQNVYSNDFNEITKIAEGEYKVNITVYLPHNKELHRLTLSDISLDATDPVDVSVGEKTTLEVEDYTHYGASKNQQEGGVADVSDNGIAWTYYGKPRGNVPVLINIPINVEAEDDYKISASMAYTTVGSTYIYVDGERVFYNLDGGEASGNYLLYLEGYGELYHMADYSAKYHLTPGEHMITVSGSTTGDLLRFAVDYVALEKWYENPISQAEATRIEAEDYALEFAQAFGQTTYDEPEASYYLPTSGVVAKYIPDTTVKMLSGNAAMWAAAADGDATMEIPVTVIEDGIYRIALRIGDKAAASSATRATQVTFVDEKGNEYSFGGGLINNVQYKDPDKVTDKETGEVISNGPLESQMWPVEAKEFTDAKVYASGSGIYTVYTGVQKLPVGAYTAKITFIDGIYRDRSHQVVLDYIDVLPVETVATVDEVIEAEDYIMVANAENKSASGGKLAYTAWSYLNNTPTTTYSIPITVEEDGYYEVETAMHYATATNTTNITLSVDGVVAYTNTKAGEDLSKGDGEADFVSSSFRVNKYAGNKVYLTKGDHNIEFEMKITNDNAYKFAIDYVKLIKTEDRMYFGTETEEDPDDEDFLYIETRYGKPVSGDAYMVFYNDGKLVDFSKAGGVSENNPIAIVAAIPPKEEYDYIKLLVWEHCDPGKNMTLKPCALAIGFAK